MKIYGQTRQETSIYRDPATPCRFLVGAVITRALLDLKYPNIREEAEEWFFEPSSPEEPFSFAWCAHQMHLDAEFMRQAIRSEAQVILSRYQDSELIARW